MAVEAVDLCLGRIMAAVREAGGILLVTADHGNAEEMYETDKKTGAVKRDAEGNPKAKTAHTLNPVWFIAYDPSGGDDIAIDPGVTSPGISNIAATCFQLLGMEPPAWVDPPLLVFE
jgi:2,3-bisphosphoglycerate-independent phosphoglycerate mutase